MPTDTDMHQAEDVAPLLAEKIDAFVAPSGRLRRLQAFEFFPGMISLSIPNRQTTCRGRSMPTSPRAKDARSIARAAVVLKKRIAPDNAVARTVPLAPPIGAEKGGKSPMVSE
jgi:hypothetical protein